MINTQYINLNMIPSGVMPVLYCSQYDIGRPLGVVVYNGSESVDLSSYTCTIEATRTDKTPVTAAVITSGNIGVFETTATMTNQADTYKGKLVLTDGNGKRVASLAFVLVVTVRTMDEDAEEIEEDASLYQQYTGTVQTIIASIRADLAAEIIARQNAISTEASTRAAAVSAEASARQSADNTLQSNINAEASTRATQDASLQSQIDQLIAPSGEAPSAAEVENARIGSDGTVYPTLGDAIRTQNSLLKSHLEDIYTTAIGDITFTDDYLVSSSGDITANTGSTIAEFAVHGGGYKIYLSPVYNVGSRSICAYNAGGICIACLQSGVADTSYEGELPADCVKVKATIRTANKDSFAANYKDATALTQINQLTSEVERSVRLRPIFNMYDATKEVVSGISTWGYADVSDITGYITLTTDGNYYGYIDNIKGLTGSTATALTGEVVRASGSARTGYKIDVTDYDAISFRYRNTYAANIMVVIGEECPLNYEPFALRAKTYNDADEPYYVKLNGNDSNDGKSVYTALATVMRAIALGGRKILVERGEYTERIYVYGIDGLSISPLNNDDAFSNEHPNRQKIVFKGTTSDGQRAVFINCNNLFLEDITFDTANLNTVEITGCNNAVIKHCDALNSATLMGFAVNNSDVIFDCCYASGNYYDGFNFHGYGNSVMNNCVSENNTDDGCSHHDGCIGFINGGRFEGNGKAGIAPAYGAMVDINDVLAKDNRIGIGYLSTNNGHQNMKGIVNSCALVGNTEGLKVDALCSVTAINCKYSGNTSDKNVSGTLVEY